jgi:hypothetical protein
MDAAVPPKKSPTPTARRLRFQMLLAGDGLTPSIGCAEPT